MFCTEAWTTGVGVARLPAIVRLVISTWPLRMPWSSKLAAFITIYFGVAASFGAISRMRARLSSSCLMRVSIGTFSSRCVMPYTIPVGSTPLRDW